MKRAPTNKNVCLWQYNVAHAMLSMAGANNADKVHEIENLVKLWGALKGKKVLPQDEAQECHDNAAAMSGELARAYHSESAKTKNPETLGYAEKLYKVYLEVFPDAEDYARDPVLLRRAAVEPRGGREERAPPDRAVGERGRRVHRRRQDRQGQREADEGARPTPPCSAWKNALDVDPRVKQQVADEDPKSLDKKAEPKPIPRRASRRCSRRSTSTSSTSRTRRTTSSSG